MKTFESRADEVLLPEAADFDGAKLDEVRYCISEEQRQEQVWKAMTRGLPRFEPVAGVSQQPVGIACYGPSLHQTWQRLKGYSYIFTMSGSHDFLLARDIKPTVHLECDPRPHKAEFLKNPCKDTVYIISSCCHPNVFEALKGYRVSLIHMLNEPVHKLPYTYKPGDWLVTGGSNVGLRALVVARMMGFVRQHVFGMDCSFEQSTHAGPHPNDKHKRISIKVGDRVYETSNVFMTYARQFFHEVRKLPDVKVTLHGVGLLQNVVANKLKQPMTAEEAMTIIKAKPAEVIALTPKEK